MEDDRVVDYVEAGKRGTRREAATGNGTGDGGQRGGHVRPIPEPCRKRPIQSQPDDLYQASQRIASDAQ